MDGTIDWEIRVVSHIGLPLSRELTQTQFPLVREINGTLTLISSAKDRLIEH